MKPFFSIIIPLYNRERFIRRTLDSCLLQDFSDFEVVVVDDGSTDASSERVMSLRDSRIRLLRHSHNRGRCPARNTAMAAAAGEWFVFLDSDDELLPSALRTMHARAATAALEVGALRFMCRDERGRRTPDPPHADELWNYEGYIRWLEALRGRASEALPCTRATTFPLIRYPDDHSEEGLYHLDIAQNWNVFACSDVVRLYHEDANDRVTAPGAYRRLRYAPDAAANVSRVLQRHGGAMRRWAPAVLGDLLRTGVLSSLLDGDRRGGWRFAIEYLRLTRSARRISVILAAGLIHARLLAAVQYAHGVLREWTRPAGHILPGRRLNLSDKARARRSAAR